MGDRTQHHLAGEAIHGLFREVFKLQAVLSKIMDEVHQKAGLSTSQRNVMRLLRDSGPATVPDLAAQLGVSRQFVQTVCNDMLRLGFSEFTENPRHKRSKLVSLTDRGDTAYQKARLAEHSIIEQTLPEIAIEEAVDACDLLERIRTAVERKSEEI